MNSPLISVEELLPHLDDPAWVIADCRHDLTNPDWGRQQYHAGHIPGAVFVHLDEDLAGPVTPQTGRHPLPDPATFLETLGRLGIHPGAHVAAYDHMGGAYAARLWWLLRQMGHPSVSVLDGGFQRWANLGCPTRAGEETRPALPAYPGRFRPVDIVSADEVDRARTDGRSLLIDARSPERFRGEVEPIDTRAGHIPGAVNRFHGQNLDRDGRFLPPQTLRAQFLDLLDGHAPQDVIAYCGSGVTSCHLLLAMEAAGLPGARLYPGSWSEWIRDPDHAIATGP